MKLTVGSQGYQAVWNVHGNYCFTKLADGNLKFPFIILLLVSSKEPE